MNALLRNSIICLIVNVVIFIIGWGCIVPDQLSDQTHLFGLVGDIQIVKGNTATVFGICCILSTLIMVVSIVEAIVEEYRPRFCPTTRAEKPRKPQKFEAARMRIEPTSEKVCEDPKASEKDEDPKTPTMD